MSRGSECDFHSPAPRNLVGAYFRIRSLNYVVGQLSRLYAILEPYVFPFDRGCRRFVSSDTLRRGRCARPPSRFGTARTRSGCRASSKNHRSMSRRLGSISARYRAVWRDYLKTVWTNRAGMWSITQSSLSLDNVTEFRETPEFCVVLIHPQFKDDSGDSPALVIRATMIASELEGQLFVAT